jgi:hypothetical protein
MMKLTQTAIDEIKAVIQKPLAHGELRQIEAMGNLFISSQKFPEGDDGLAICDIATMDFWFQYSLRINGVPYYLYGGTPIAN